MMITRNINKNLVDVFVGNGWENWSRWSITNKGYVKQVAGEPVSRIVRAMVIKNFGG